MGRNLQPREVKEGILEMSLSYLTNGRFIVSYQSKTRVPYHDDYVEGFIDDRRR